MAPLHALTSVKKVFHWGDVEQKSFDALKKKINSTLVLALLNLRQPFEIQTDVSDYAMGAVLMQHGKSISFHLENFNSVVTNYPTYDKELYALVQSVKKWKHYLMGKETIIHTDHQPLQVLTVTVQVATITTLQMDGFSTTVSFGYQVQKWNLQ